MFVLLVFGNPRSFSFSNISFFTIAFCLLWISCARKLTKTLWQKIKKYVCTLESLVYNNLVRTIFRQVRSDGMVAQPGERPPHTREVTGSSPVHPMPRKPLKSTFLLVLKAFFMLGSVLQVYYPNNFRLTILTTYHIYPARFSMADMWLIF